MNALGIDLLDFIENRADPEFCPFCGLVLPGIRRRDTREIGPICVVTDGVITVIHARRDYMHVHVYPLNIFGKQTGEFKAY